ncbi:MAG: hypothetical protein Q9174_003466 [Haloplaca sp. 1 TL-2023]
MTKQEMMRYEIKWKGYEAKKDRTWETEENLQGAREILEAYWASIGGRPMPSARKASKSAGTGKKRGRASTGTIAEPAQKKTKKRPGRKSASAAQDPDATPEPPTGFTNVDAESWTAPEPLDNAWDPLVMNIDTIEKDANNELWAYLVWNEKNDDGRYYRSKARLSTCNKACPQRMLQFYEKHVVFTNNKETYAQENGATST